MLCVEPKGNRFEAFGLAYQIGNHQDRDEACGKVFIMNQKKLRRIILNLKAIHMACFSAAQDSTEYSVISMDREAQDALAFAIEELSKKIK